MLHLLSSRNEDLKKGEREPGGRKMLAETGEGVREREQGGGGGGPTQSQTATEWR